MIIKKNNLKAIFICIFIIIIIYLKYLPCNNNLYCGILCIGFNM